MSRACFQTGSIVVMLLYVRGQSEENPSVTLLHVQVGQRKVVNHNPKEIDDVCEIFSQGIKRVKSQRLKNYFCESDFIIKPDDVPATKEEGWGRKRGREEGRAGRRRREMRKEILATMR